MLVADLFSKNWVYGKQARGVLVLQTLAATLIPLTSVTTNRPQPEDFAGGWKHTQTIKEMRDDVPNL